MRNMTDFGAFIEIEEGIDGLVHVSDLSWTKRVKHPSEVLKKGQMVQAVILNIDASPTGCRWASSNCSRTPGRASSRRTRWATWCMAACAAWPASAPSSNWRRAWKACATSRKCRAIRAGRADEPPLAVGQEYDFKIIKMSEAEKKIGLSLRAVAEDEEKTRLEDYQRQAAAATIDHRRGA